MTISRYGSIFVLFVAFTLAVLLVRDGKADAPSGHYMYDSETVLDTKTKLTWQRPLSPNTYDWNDAQTYCMQLDLKGTGWRVPSMKELATLVDETRTSPAIDITAFPDTPGSFFWTSSPKLNDSSRAWHVDFQVGLAIGAVMSVTTAFPVRCVR